ncbi:SMI1/KNR4 family protein [Chryseobacterium camelliae]|uniref:SMI1/KNR4 family protein n=1 Tax=Chryseobacterium camelliae TaxID=1265445 RepID=A0ABY7QIL1_9FLAO|nr:SMI1/KNR4 family protein [Chryseobacterium camelliae]WBV59455.1 SMI1/KNR4 family protein [Chryseobacterium camelliae]
MKANPDIIGEKNDGINESQIVEMEKFSKNKFPDSYREFLFLGGKNNNIFQSASSSSFNRFKSLRESVENVLTEDNYKIEKDFWVISSLDGGEQFHFFFYDEGENPPVYYYCSYLSEWENENGKGTPGYKKISDTFSEYLEKKIKALKS